ncbi:MAG: lysoplasmalogenase [Ruminococcaceae bacterium]|nr:lysoplasmalogenase [Oscillospiraceae bacterium]
MKNKALFITNIIVIAAVLVGNYFYQSNNFDFTLKCICSGGFAALGVLNFFYMLKTKQKNLSFYLTLCLGIFFAMLGDIMIKFSFVAGAAVFAVGHIFFFVAYCFLQKIKTADIVIGGSVFIAGTLFLILCPLLKFDPPFFRIVCIFYALIISMMLGKAVGNFIREKNTFTFLLAIASFLFFFSDLMLVFDWFIGLWSWTDHACMGTYYPSLCISAFAMLLYKNKQ